jgi:hypothetical protein
MLFLAFHRVLEMGQRGGQGMSGLLFLIIIAPLPPRHHFHIPVTLFGENPVLSLLLLLLLLGRNRSIVLKLVGPVSFVSKTTCKARHSEH